MTADEVNARLDKLIEELQKKFNKNWFKDV